MLQRREATIGNLDCIFANGNSLGRQGLQSPDVGQGGELALVHIDDGKVCLNRFVVAAGGCGRVHLQYTDTF
jgi:hypothetical protein